MIWNYFIVKRTFLYNDFPEFRDFLWRKMCELKASTWSYTIKLALTNLRINLVETTDSKNFVNIIEIFRSFIQTTNSLSNHKTIKPSSTLWSLTVPHILFIKWNVSYSFVHTPLGNIFCKLLWKNKHSNDYKYQGTMTWQSMLYS